MCMIMPLFTPSILEKMHDWYRAYAIIVQDAYLFHSGGTHSLRMFSNPKQVYASAVPGNVTTPSVFSGTFQGPTQTLDEILAIVNPLAQHFNSSYGSDIQSEILEAHDWSSYYDWYLEHQTDAATPAGIDIAFASRILDDRALNNANFSRLIQQAARSGAVAFNVVAGPGTHAYPIIGVVWPPLNATAKAEALEKLTYNWSAALRELAPDSGIYLNEPDFQEAFWGTNYPRLLEIKREVDLEDVLWCEACAVNERWEDKNGMLCRV
ncbi:hypothetical protein BT63DRAFT_479205 [Microthyrium microscopicum]|uniref:Berberine/berberine-like domain-containing protein n=1 Tax=Microthyrium microscopicum TaxID=703497 RepID=A0A6A6UB00_9PEZI|nr:hypothetical protein BT63DRAFT_479205 [Microthyrium microscopicum]